MAAEYLITPNNKHYYINQLLVIVVFLKSNFKKIMIY
ncbi:MAG: hypothetical protein RL766_1310 [Bacteroidota bacterium]|jgi:hypothetical protein